MASNLDLFFQNDLQPATECPICQEPLDKDHTPVLLKCRHVFGHSCLVTWLRSGQGNSNTKCPLCRDLLFDNRLHPIWAQLFQEGYWEKKRILLSDFLKIYEATRIFARSQKVAVSRDITVFERTLFELSETDHISGPFRQLWNGVKTYWGKEFTTYNLADLRSGRCIHDTDSEAAKFGHAWLKLQVLVGSLADAKRKLGLSLPTVEKTPEFWDLVWKAFRCVAVQPDLGIHIHWDMLYEASELKNDRYFHLLWLCTVLISLDIHYGRKFPWSDYEAPQKRNEVYIRYLELRASGHSCIFNIKTKSESDFFLEKFVVVYGELHRLQQELGKTPLTGKNEEQDTVRVLWRVFDWKTEKQA